jgi:uncharacterized SAM-binding protein YcdF (DUF218 family)
VPRDDGPVTTTTAPDTARGESRRRHSWRWWAVRIVLAIAALMVVYVGVTFLQVWRASRGDSARPSDAIVVLGAAQYNGRPSPVLQNRLDKAYELYAAGVAPRIVTTGANRAGDVYTEGYVGFDYLRGKGVPESALIVVTDGVNTWEELAATARQLKPLGLKRVLLVSDGYHAARVEHTADELGLSAAVARPDGSASLRQLARETAAVSVGRIIGFRRLAELS